MWLAEKQYCFVHLYSRMDFISKWGKRYKFCINYKQFENQQEVQVWLSKVDESYFGLTFAFFSELLLP